MACCTWCGDNLGGTKFFRSIVELVDLVGVDVFVDVAESRVVGVASTRAAAGREAALVDFVSLDVT